MSVFFASAKLVTSKISHLRNEQTFIKFEIILHQLISGISCLGILCTGYSDGSNEMMRSRPFYCRDDVEPRTFLDDHYLAQKRLFPEMPQDYQGDHNKRFRSQTDNFSMGQRLQYPDQTFNHPGYFDGCQSYTGNSMRMMPTANLIQPATEQVSVSNAALQALRNVPPQVSEKAPLDPTGKATIIIMT